MIPKMRHAKSKDPKDPGLRGSRALREALAREYQVEKVPESFQNAMEAAYRGLPEDMPRPHRPVRAFVRRSAAVLAALVLVFAGLWGVNGTYPQLTEAIPGLGQVFRAVNGGQEVPPAPPVQEKEKPRFQPVTVPSQDPALTDLTVEDAWCDGNTIYLNLSLGFAESFFYQLQDSWGKADGFPAGGEFVLLPTFWGVWLNDLDATHLTEMPVVDMEGKDRVYWQALIRLSDIEVEGQTKVSLEIQELDFCEKIQMQDVWCLSPGFHVDLTVSTDSSRNYAITIPAQDNGATVTKVDFSPSKVEVDVEMPYIGWCQDLFIHTDLAPAPLGSFAQLRTLDGSQVVYRLEDMHAVPEAAEADGEKDLWDGGLRDGVWKRPFVFRSSGNPRALRGPLALTLYETPEEDAEGRVLDQIASRRVVAEFTINLDTGRIMPSERYKEEGREKVDPERDIAGVLEKGFTGGFRVCEASVEGYNGIMYIQLLASYDNSPNLLLFNAYRGGEQIQSLVVDRKNEYDKTDSGEYSINDLRLFQEVDAPYCVIEANLFYPTDEDGVFDDLRNGPCDRLELVNGDTGEVMIHDLFAAREFALRTAIGEPAGESVQSRSEEEPSGKGESEVRY